jgi:AhpD family alkylhydroperoxidase
MKSIYKSDAGRQAIHALYRRALQQWPIPHHELIVTTRHGDTFVIATGDAAAPALVLLHGSGANSSTWIREIAALSRDLRVYATDMIGEPGFSAETRPPLASDAYAAWLDDVWSALGIARASIAGVSLGGWLAIDYAIRRPGRVRSLSLISPSGIGRQNTALLMKAAILLQLGEWGRRRALRHGHMLGGQAARVLDFLDTFERSSTSARREMQASYGGRPEALRAKGRESRASSPGHYDRVMATLGLIEYEHASADVRAVYDDIMATRKTDWINNFWKALAHDPATLRRTWQSVKEIMAPGELDVLTKEMVYLAVSATNQCGYCIASHTAAARKAGMTDGMLAELMAVVGMANESNRLASGYQVEIDDRFKL